MDKIIFGFIFRFCLQLARRPQRQLHYPRSTKTALPTDFALQDAKLEGFLLSSVAPPQPKHPQQIARRATTSETPRCVGLTRPSLQRENTRKFLTTGCRSRGSDRLDPLYPILMRQTASQATSFSSDFLCSHNPYYYHM